MLVAGVLLGLVMTDHLISNSIWLVDKLRFSLADYRKNHQLFLGVAIVTQ